MTIIKNRILLVYKFLTYINLIGDVLMAYTDIKNSGLKKIQEENQAWEAHKKSQEQCPISKQEAWEIAEKEILQFKYV